jgi:MFS family permease
LAAAAGPLLGGWIVDHFSWRWIFFVNSLLTVPTVWIALYHVPESRDPEAKPGLDWQGAFPNGMAICIARRERSQKTSLCSALSGI